MLQTLPQQRKKETSTGKMSFAITVQYVFESGGRRTLMYSSKLNNVSIQLHYTTLRTDIHVAGMSMRSAIVSHRTRIALHSTLFCGCYCCY